jgi:hypothetical protein
MTHSTSTQSLLTMRFAIPAYWTPDQALAVVELLDDLRELIWAHYGTQITDNYPDQYMPKSSGPESEGTSRATPKDTSF